MLTNSNRLGKQNQVSTQWVGGVLDMRTHHGVKANNRFPDYLDNNNAVTENGFFIGRYTGNSAFVSGQDTTMANMFVSNDGTRMYFVGTTNDRIYQYSLTYPYLTGGNATTFVNFFAFGTTVVDPTGLFISPDGTRLFVLGSAADTVYSYTFGTAWDVTTLVYDSKSFSVTTQEPSPRGLAVKPDGTKFWIVGPTNDRVYEYNMSTAWDLTTASYSGLSVSVTARDTSPVSICWNSTGSQFTIMGQSTDQIFEYDAPTAWTVSGATFNGNQSGSAFGVIPLNNPAALNGYYFVPGTKYHYVVDTTLDIVFTYFSRVTDRLSSGVNSNRVTLTETFSLGLATPRTIFFKPDGSEFFVSDSMTNVIREYACTSPWTITGATLVKSVPIQGRTSTALFATAFARFWLAPDGSSIFLQDFSTGNLSEYGLRNAWDVEQMFFLKSYTGAFAASSNGWCFSRDGLSLYYVSGTTFYRRTMTTAWDINTLSATTTSYSDPNFLGGTNTLVAVAISQDGMYLYGLTANAARVFKYRLSTPWDITTANFWTHAYVEDFIPTPNGGLFFSPDGGNMYIIDDTNDTLYRWVLNGEGA